MGIPHTKVIQLQRKGITSVNDLAACDKDTLQQLADNLQHPGGHVPDPNPGAQAGATIPIPGFMFMAKSQKMLKSKSDKVRQTDCRTEI